MLVEVVAYLEIARCFASLPSMEFMSKPLPYFWPRLFKERINATNESSGQCPAVPDLVHVSGSDTAVLDHGLDATSEALPLKLLKQPKNTKKKVTIDEIYEMHLAVLQKEQIKLDLEIENLHLKKREIMLRIQELESKANLFSC